MINLRCSTDSIDIEGDEKGFNAIRQAIALVVYGGLTIARINTRKIDPAPYDDNPTALVIELSDGRNVFLLNGDELIVRGSSSSLTSLATNLPLGTEQTESGISYHHHYDHISFPDFCAKNSPAVTLTSA